MSRHLAVAFALFSLLPSHSPPPAPAAIAPNDNRHPAGRMERGVLTLALEVREGWLQPEGDGGPGVPALAFAEAGKPPERPEQIDVAVDAQGKYLINKSPVVFNGPEAFSQELKRAAGNMKEPVIIIGADANAPHQSVINIMEAARIAGADDQAAVVAEVEAGHVLHLQQAGGQRPALVAVNQD